MASKKPRKTTAKRFRLDTKKAQLKRMRNELPKVPHSLGHIVTKILDEKIKVETPSGVAIVTQRELFVMRLQSRATAGDPVAQSLLLEMIEEQPPERVSERNEALQRKIYHETHPVDFAAIAATLIPVRSRDQ